ncbi:hypothetical protein JKF63_01088 [Porcisia hertigi]|uniref:Transmembrane protein n=1 Tax=Porcisia hertigi TaxID=2761500 RepID=A0A836HXF2_9TRYP|nr:hypothetical protein JKF63_01088 [Porcisia hertigi]
MHNMNRVMAATVACPAVGTHTAWKAQQQLRHGLQGSMSSTPLLSSLPLLRLSTSQMTATAVFPCVQRCQNLKMAVRLQHATPTREATVPSTSAHESSPSVSSSHDNLGGDDVRIDPRRLPGTIPGITQEELAARIVKYHSQRSRQVKEMSAKAVAQEVELMRRSLSPNAFAEYMAHLEEKQKAAAAEEARMAAMSTVELHHYQQKKRRQAARYQWYKTFLVISALLGSTVFLFSLFLFFK